MSTSAAPLSAAERQRRRRAKLALQAEPRQPQECDCCGRLWVPQRQGRYCGRHCVERAGRFRRRLADSNQLEALSSWLGSTGAALRGQRQRSNGAIAIRKAVRADSAERQRLLQAHRHMLDPMVEAELVLAGWIWGPMGGCVRHSAMAQADPALARERSGGAQW